jgi:phosphoglycerate dehydrogenase-like enzyme
MDSLTDRGVVVSNGSGIHAPGIAEQALGCCLTFARRLHEGWHRKRRAEWRHYKADEFAGSTVTVVGMGAIGTELVERLQGMDVHTIGVRYTPEKGGATDEVIGFGDREFHRALSRTDYLVLATPLSDTTRGLVSEEEFGTLPPNAVVVNVCRGAVLDTDALLAAVRNESIRGAAVDVTDPEPLPQDHPLWRMNNVLITPHMGGHTPKHWDRLADVLCENVRLLDEGATDSYRNQVNDPVSVGAKR